MERLRTPKANRGKRMTWPPTKFRLRSRVRRRDRWVSRLALLNLRRWYWPSLATQRVTNPLAARVAMLSGTIQFLRDRRQTARSAVSAGLSLTRLASAHPASR